MIDMTPNAPLYDSALLKLQNSSIDDGGGMVAKMDIESLFSQMPNRRYVYVIRRLILEEADPKDVAEELKTNVDNLYNIKKRAIAALTEVALKEY
jgi:hypothetical protein